MNTINALTWRYATKQFDNDKQVSKEDLNTILEAGNLAATSYGLQPFSFIVVSDDEIKQRLLTHAYNQAQITSCSHLIVLAAATNVDEKYIEQYIERIAEVRGMSTEDLAGFRDAMVSDIANRSPEDIVSWAKRQSYIALGSMMVAAGEMKIDGCPMEGFNTEKFDEVLGLEEENLTSVALFPIGYRSEQDETQHYKKVRKDINNIVIRK